MSDDPNIDIRPVDPANSSVWTTFVTGHPNATVFHSPEWLSVIETTFGYDRSHRLAYDSTGEPVAAIPGFVVRDGLYRSVVNPFCEYGFPLIDERVADEHLLSFVRSVPDRLSAWVIKDVDWSGVRGYYDAEYGGVRTGVARRLPVDDSFDRIWESTFARQVRQHVRTAEERDVRLTEGTIEEFYPLYLRTMERLGSPQFPLRFFETLRTHLDDRVVVLLAQVGGRSIGAILALEWHDTVHIWANGSMKADWEYQPNHLLYSSLIERACEGESSVVDFGRSRRGTGVHEFKSQFGGIAHPLVSFVTPPHRSERASLEGYGRLAPATRRLAPIITHPAIGPRLKRFIHE